jgi:hypothetical protein
MVILKKVQGILYKKNQNIFKLFNYTMQQELNLLFHSLSIL